MNRARTSPLANPETAEPYHRTGLSAYVHFLQTVPDCDPG